MKSFDDLYLQGNSLLGALFDASLNTLSKLSPSMFASGAIKTSLTGTVDDTTLPSSKAAKDYADSAASAAVSTAEAFASSLVTNATHLVGGLDATTGVPTAGTGATGAIMKSDFWIVTVAGTIAGVTPNATLEVGDLVYASVDAATTGSQFFAIQANVTAATTTVPGTIALATSEETIAKSISTKAVVPSDLATFGRKSNVTVTTDGTTATYTVAHGLGVALPLLSVTFADGTTGESFYLTPSIAGSDVTNQFSVTFNPVYPAGSFIAHVSSL